MALSKAKILSAKDVKVETLPVPEWGGDVFVKTLSGTERDAFEDAYSSDKMKNFRVRFLVLTLCDENGERLFSDSEIEELGKKSASVISRLFEKSWAINAFRSEDVDALGKDSATVPSGDSISA
jgi:hypothetical protein